MRCERDYCGHAVDAHNREVGGSTRTCARCPCPRPVVDGMTWGGAPKREPEQVSMIAVDPARVGGDTTGVVITTIGDMDAEREAILARIDAAPQYVERLLRARQLALLMAKEWGTVTVAEVREKFCLVYGGNAWADEHGSTYWAGAIFRDRETWEACGTTKSPYNHNDSNRVWKLRRSPTKIEGIESTSEASSNEARSLDAGSAGDRGKDA